MYDHTMPARKTHLPLDAEELAAIKAEALIQLRFARDHNILDLRAEVVADGTRLEYNIVRQAILVDTGVDDLQAESGNFDERITVKRGPRNNPEIVFAGPAEWIQSEGRKSA